MPSNKNHQSSLFFLRYLTQPFLALSCILLLPIILTHTGLTPPAFDSHHTLGTICVLVSIPLLAIPYFCAERQRVFDKPINLKTKPLISSTLGVALSFAGLHSLLWDKSFLYVALFSLSIAIAIYLNWHDLHAMNKEERNLHK